MVYRSYVEKKPALANEARGLLENLRAFLGIESLTGLRLLNRYDVEGIDGELFHQAVPTVFSEPPARRHRTTRCPHADAVFAVEYLPGQFDQRADSAAQCIQLLTPGRAARSCAPPASMLLDGELTDAELAAIKQYVINPVEAREACLDERRSTLQMEYAIPTTVRTVDGFTALDERALEALRNELGLAMDLDDRRSCQRYFRDDEHRDPTITEIRRGGHLLVRPLPPHHLLHPHRRRGDRRRAVQAAYERYLAARVEVYGDGKGSQAPPDPDGHAPPSAQRP